MTLYGTVVSPASSFAVRILPDRHIVSFVMELVRNYSDLAIMHSAEDWQSLEETPTQDMATLSSYLQKWKLKLCIIKMVTAAFHLYNKEATREFKVAAEGRIFPFSPEPTYLGVKLDRSLRYRRHLESLHKKLTTRVGLLRRLAESSWGQNVAHS